MPNEFTAIGSIPEMQNAHLFRELNTGPALAVAAAIERFNLDCIGFNSYGRREHRQGQQTLAEGWDPNFSQQSFNQPGYAPTLALGSPGLPSTPHNPQTAIPLDPLYGRGRDLQTVNLDRPFLELNEGLQESLLAMRGSLEGVRSSLQAWNAGRGDGPMREYEDSLFQHTAQAGAAIGTRLQDALQIAGVAENNTQVRREARRERGPAELLPREEFRQAPSPDFQHSFSPSPEAGPSGAQGITPFATNMYPGPTGTQQMPYASYPRDRASHPPAVHNYGPGPMQQSHSDPEGRRTIQPRTGYGF